MKTQKELKQEYEEILKTEVWEGSPDMVKHCMKNIGHIVELENGDIVVLDKPTIKKRFCFGYSCSPHDTESYDNANKMVDHARASEDYFRKENLKQIENKIERLKDETRARFKWGIMANYREDNSSKLKTLYQYDQFDGKEHTEATADDINRVIEGYKEVKKAFEKRLSTYLKRYGLKHVHAWSYWRDA